MKHIILTFLISSFMQLLAAQNDFSYKDYDEANGASSFIRFNMESTKLGFITTGFSGVVKSFNIAQEEKITLTFKVADLDTDNSSRNEKMWEKCLDYKNHPVITVEIAEKPSIGEQTLNAKISLRGYTKEFPVKVLVTKNEEGLLAKGSALLKISELEIPDPSIAIAKVKDEINLEFNFLLK